MEVSMLIWSFLLGTVVVVMSDHELRIYNACPFMVWFDVFDYKNPNVGKAGGLHQCASQSVLVPNQFQGIVWARTGCDELGNHCQTGDCGNFNECKGQPNPPETAAIMALDQGFLGRFFDRYSISVTDGFNLPMTMKPIDGTVKLPSSSENACRTAGCSFDLNTICPDELVLKNSDGRTVGCKSACIAFNTDEYCCRGNYYGKRNCKPESWPKDYPRIFKKACPDTITYKFDNNGTFSCESNSTGTSGYVITFCR